MENDRDVRLISRAKETQDTLGRYSRICPLAEEVLKLRDTQEGIDKIFELPEIEYDKRFNHLVYHLAHPNTSEEETIRITSEPLRHYS